MRDAAQTFVSLMNAFVIIGNFPRAQTYLTRAPAKIPTRQLYEGDLFAVPVRRFELGAQILCNLSAADNKFGGIRHASCSKSVQVRLDWGPLGTGPSHHLRAGDIVNANSLEYTGDGIDINRCIGAAIHDRLAATGWRRRGGHRAQLNRSLANKAEVKQLQAKLAT